MNNLIYVYGDVHVFNKLNEDHIYPKILNLSDSDVEYNWNNLDTSRLDFLLHCSDNIKDKFIDAVLSGSAKRVYEFWKTFVYKNEPTDNKFINYLYNGLCNMKVNWYNIYFATIKCDNDIINDVKSNNTLNDPMLSYYLFSLRNDVYKIKNITNNIAFIGTSIAINVNNPDINVDESQHDGFETIWQVKFNFKHAVNKHEHMENTARACSAFLQYSV